MNTKTFNERLKEFSPKLKKICDNCHIAYLTSEDIQQEVKVKLWENKDKFDPERGKWNTFFYTVARNKINDLNKFYQQQKRKVNYVSLDELEEQGIDIEG